MEGSTPFTVKSGFVDGYHVLVVEGELDMDDAPTLDAAMDACPDEIPLVIDLTSVTFIDSTGIHTLLRERETGRPAAVVRAPDSNVARVLDIVDAQGTLPVFDDLDAARSVIG